MVKRISILIALAVALAAGPAAAMFKCKASDGSTSFSDKPCGTSAVEYAPRYQPSSSMPAPPPRPTVDPAVEERRQLEVERLKLEAERRALQQMAPAGPRVLSDSEQRKLVRKNKVARGMDEEHLYKSWGKPDKSFRRFNDDGSITLEYIFEESGRGHTDRRVYLKEGRVIDVFDVTGQH